MCRLLFSGAQKYVKFVFCPTFVKQPFENQNGISLLFPFRFGISPSKKKGFDRNEATESKKRLRYSIKIFCCVLSVVCSHQTFRCVHVWQNRSSVYSVLWYSGQKDGQQQRTEGGEEKELKGIAKCHER